MSKTFADRLRQRLPTAVGAGRQLMGLDAAEHRFMESKVLQVPSGRSHNGACQLCLRCGGGHEWLISRCQTPLPVRPDMRSIADEIATEQVLLEFCAAYA